MDEQSWLNGRDPTAMFRWLHDSGKASDRKLRLFAVACCRQIWHAQTDARWRKAVEAAEQVTEEQGPAEELETAAVETLFSINAEESYCAAGHAAWTAGLCVLSTRSDMTGHLSYKVGLLAAEALEDLDATHAARWRRLLKRARLLKGSFGRSIYYPTAHAGRIKQAALLRDLFGNPFRPPPTLDPACLTPQVVALARRAYEERKLPEGTLHPALLAVLADALEEGGCDDKDVLGHLREQGIVHVRGCWVLGLLLNKG